MRKKLFTLLLAVAASVGTMFAWDYERVQIGDLYYNLDATNLTAEVTSQNSDYPYWATIITTANIPASVTYNSVTYTVTSIGDRAFQNCSGLTSVTIGNSVTSIGKSAFYGCSGLTSVEIPNTVTSIGTQAFCFCSGLTSVTIGNSVTSIGEYAFYGCTGLTSVTIPNSVTSIGNYAFSGCTGLTSVVLNSDAIVSHSYSYNNNIKNVFGSQVTEYIIGDSVTSIGEYAFYQCSGLTSVTIGNSVTSIGDYAFRNCSGLTSVTIPNSVTSIGRWAFDGCTGLTSVTIPNSVTSIGDFAFSSCSGLTSVTILSDNFETEGAIFINCPNLTYMSGPAKMLYMTDAHLSLYTISRRLKNVIITGGEMTENEFLALHEAYKSLESVDMSAASNTTLSDEAFKDCYNLTELKLPAGLTKINYMAVAGCKNLQSINIPASVEEIEQSAFEDCRSIQTITFGGSSASAPGRFNAPATASQLRRIGNWAFYNAHELQNLEIPEGVTEIGDGAFYGCTYLEEMVLPSSVQSIGDNCFALCAKLTKITCNAVTPPTIQAKTFFNVKRQIPVYVPDEAVSAYEDDTYWQEFNIQGQSEVPQGVEEVPSDQVQSTKFLRNGQIYILRGEKVYTVTGQEVK